MTLFPLNILDGVYFFMRSDAEQQNLFLIYLVVELGSMEMNSSLTRLSLKISLVKGGPSSVVSVFLMCVVVGEPEIQKLEKSGRKVAEF